MSKIKKIFRKSFFRKMGDKNSEPETFLEAAVVVDSESVSPLNLCQLEDAKKLIIYDIHRILEESTSKHVIGGVYEGKEPKLYFYCSTVACPGENYLLNIFVCHRKTGNYSLGISKGINITEQYYDSNHKECILDNDFEYISMRSIQSEKNYYVRTICFNKTAFKKLRESTLIIPISLRSNPNITVDKKIIIQIKRDNNLSILLNKRDMADFDLISLSGKRHRVHKAILAAHSPVLRDYIKKTSEELYTFDFDDKVIEFVVEFLYTGAIKVVCQQNLEKLQEAASQLELRDLRYITEKYLNKQSC